MSFLSSLMGAFGGGGGGGGGGMIQMPFLPNIQLPGVPGADETPQPQFTPVPKKITNESRYPMVDPQAGYAGTIATGGLGVTGQATVRRPTLLGSG